MISLPKLSDFNLTGKKVIVRGDLDVEIPDSRSQITTENILRLQVLKPTTDLIFEKGAKCIILMGHRGRPSGNRDKNLSMGGLVNSLERVLEKKVIFTNGIVESGVNQEIFLLENLRFDEREEKDDEGYAKELALLGDFYVNEAFSVCHRSHASIVGIPKFIPHAAGLRLALEIENLAKVIENPDRPVVVIISGAKEDKLSYIEGFLKYTDKILIGGRLPLLIQNSKFKIQNEKSKIKIAHLIQDGEDITMHSIEDFEKEIEKAKTIIVAGPVGKYEDEGHRQGTERIFTKIAGAEALKVACGGDSESAIRLFKLTDRFNWISVGGGAALEFLTKGTLPGIEALAI